MKIQAMYTALAISVQAVGVTVIGLIAYAACVWLPLPFWIKATLTVSAGILGWAKLLYATPGLKKPLYTYWFISNEPVHAAVVGKMIAQDHWIDTTANEGAIRNIDLSTMREIGPGWHGKLPSERRIRTYRLDSHVVIGNDKSKPFIVQVLQAGASPNAKRIPLELDWQLPYRMLRGYLRNATLISDDVATAQFYAEASGFLYSWALDKTDDEMFSMWKKDKLAKLVEDFKGFLGGKNEAVPFEKERGRVTDDLQISGLRYEKSYLEARQAGAKAAAIAEANEVLNASHHPELVGKVNPNLSLILAAAASGSLGDTNPLILIGADNVDPRTLAAVSEIAKQSNKKK